MTIAADVKVVVPRESFQDLYLVLKDRHRHLDSRAPKPGSTKVEDVKRHVFKVSLVNLKPPWSGWDADIAVAEYEFACFLFLPDIR